MGEVPTGLEEAYKVERRLPRLGWKPRRRGAGDLGDAFDVPDFDVDDFGILAIVATIVFAIIAAVVLIPLLLFVAEAALVVALVIPITVVALVVGLKQHTVGLRRVSDGLTVDSRQAHGIYGSMKAARELRAAAARGAYPARPVAAPTNLTKSVGPPG